MTGTLYICPTPIGNMGDITLRTLDALRSCDVVCAEDTRVTGKLLAHFDIKKRIERLDENMLAQQATSVAERIAAGETVAFCSDAGMPGVSDPGARLVAAAHEAGVPVVVLPGASAATTAYVASGFNNPRYYFGGFFPRKAGERRAVLQELAGLDAVLVFYESPHRIADALAVVAEVLPARQVAVCRELTKLHEEVALGPVAQVAADFAAREESGGVKGEIALVIGPPTNDEADAAAGAAQLSAAERAAQLLAEGTMSRKDVMRTLCREFNISRNAAYDLLLKM